MGLVIKVTYVLHKNSHRAEMSDGWLQHMSTNIEHVPDWGEPAFPNPWLGIPGWHSGLHGVRGQRVGIWWGRGENCLGGGQRPTPTYIDMLADNE